MKNQDRNSLQGFSFVQKDQSTTPSFQTLPKSEKSMPLPINSMEQYSSAKFQSAYMIENYKPTKNYQVELFRKNPNQTHWNPLLHKSPTELSSDTLSGQNTSSADYSNPIYNDNSNEELNNNVLS